MDIKIVFSNGYVRDVPNLPGGVSVQVYNYDLDRFSKESQEPDPEGKPCVATIWTRYPEDKLGKTVYVVRHTVRIAIKKRKIEIVDCPKGITVRVI